MVLLDLLAAWCGQGLNAAHFWDATPRIYAVAMDAAAERLRGDREWALYTAYVGAYLGRVKDMPAFRDLIGREDTPEEREARAAEHRTYLKVKSKIFRENGQERTWEEWRQHSRA